MNILKRKEADRPRAFWGALISAGVGIASALLNSKAQEKQRRLQANLEDYNNSLKEAQSMTNALNAGQDYQQNYLQQFKQQARLGTTRRLGSRNIMITDGGNAKRIGNNTYLLRGGSHEDINETGQTGIGINVGGNEIEAEGGEVAQRKGNSLRIYSAQPILGGMSPAQAIMRGYNKDKVFNAQQRFKKNNGIKDDGTKQYRPGGEVPYNHNDPTGLFGGSPHPLAKMVDISGITSYGDVKKLINKKRRGEVPTTQEYLGALSAIPAIGRIAKGLNLIGNITDATTFMKDVKESEAKENTYQNEIVKYRDIHGKIKTGRRGNMPYTAHELRKRLGGLTSKDKGSSKHPYPSVASKDFAGANRSYPIPTKADAIDALRLAGLHGRSDVRSKVYSKYPELRKKAAIGTLITPIDAKNSYIWDLLGGDRNSQSITADLKTILGLNDMYGAEDGHDSNLQYAGVSIPYLTQIIKNSPRVAKSILRGTKLYGRDLKALVEAEGESAYNKVKRIFRGNNNNVYSNIANTYSPNINTKFTGTPNSNIRPYVKPVNPVRVNNTRRAYNTAKMQAANSELKMINNPEYAEQIVGNTVRNFSKNMSGKALQSAIGVSKYQPSNFVKYGIPAFASLAAYEYAGREPDNTKKSVSTQKDAKGKPISPYISKPQEPVKPLTGYVYKPVKPLTGPKEPVKSQTKKVTKVVKPTRQVPATIARKDTTRTDTTRTDTTKQVNKVVKRQVRTTPQYKGNTTKGNYQLHDGETKIINGIKYTRRGNTIINHKTNVGYIYDKNGNYTGQADYSKVGNFNQAFDAARAAGRSQFIYRAGKYNNYSTVKETNAKKEALNRRIGARRIAKRMGCLTNPPVERFKCGGRIRPKAEDGMLAPIYSYGSDRRKFPSFAPIDVTPRAIPNFKPISIPTNTKTPFDPNSIPYLGKQSSFKPTTQDYIGLGIDTLASLGIGLINSSAASKTYLPERPAIIQASKLPTYYNVAPQVEEVKRQRDILNEEIANNTSSSVAALNRISRIRGAATGEINKLYATKENEENKMLTQDALNQQQVAAENAKLQADYETNKANILNAASQAKANALSGTLSGLSQAWTNFASTIENRYDSRQNEIAAISSSNSPSVVKNAISLGYNLSPEVLANLYKNSKNEELRNTILGRLSPNERKRYGIK